MAEVTPMKPKKAEEGSQGCSARTVDAAYAAMAAGGAGGRRRRRRLAPRERGGGGAGLARAEPPVLRRRGLLQAARRGAQPHGHRLRLAGVGDDGRGVHLCPALAARLGERGHVRAWRVPPGLRVEPEPGRRAVHPDPPGRGWLPRRGHHAPAAGAGQQQVAGRGDLEPRAGRQGQAGARLPRRARRRARPRGGLPALGRALGRVRAELRRGLRLAGALAPLHPRRVVRARVPARGLARAPGGARAGAHQALLGRPGRGSLRLRGLHGPAAHGRPGHELRRVRHQVRELPPQERLGRGRVHELGLEPAVHARELPLRLPLPPAAGPAAALRAGGAPAGPAVPGHQGLRADAGGQGLGRAARRRGAAAAGGEPGALTRRCPWGGGRRRAAPAREPPCLSSPS
mmetsp:Transcript_62240/g.193147  ORF Transcript_62240/g.193147 Transcript_62240/m.193147 type:complete len:401 (+) Transcript_62240:98-1300(+)